MRKPHKKTAKEIGRDSNVATHFWAKEEKG